jgi:hypothetical protein
MQNIQSKSLLYKKPDPFSYCPLLSFDGTYYHLDKGALPVVGNVDGVLHIVFPTPVKGFDVIGYTQRLIAEQSVGATSVTLDLRGNIGGLYSVFYNSLYAILPEEEVIIKGDRNGRDVGGVFRRGNSLTIEYDGEVTFKSPVIPCPKLLLPVTVVVNERSMSSSQLVAISLARVPGNRVMGTAPQNYTNATVYEPAYDCNVIGFNFKGDFVYSGLEESIPIRIPTKTYSGGLSLGHLRAIVNNEVYADTFHFFYSAKGHQACGGLLRGRYWIFIPNSPQSNCAKLLRNCGDKEVVLDLRGCRLDGKKLVDTLKGIMPDVKVVDGVVHADKPEKSMTVLIDNKFGHKRKPQSAIALAYFCKYHQVYGRPRKNYEFMYKPHKAPGCPLVVNIPVVKLAIRWKPCDIPAKYKLIKPIAIIS